MSVWLSRRAFVHEQTPHVNVVCAMAPVHFSVVPPVFTTMGGPPPSHLLPVGLYVVAAPHPPSTQPCPAPPPVDVLPPAPAVAPPPAPMDASGPPPPFPGVAAPPCGPWPFDVSPESPQLAAAVATRTENGIETNRMRMGHLFGTRER